MKCEGDKMYTKAGKCPVCNMNLKALPSKKKEDGHEGHNH
jgi:Cu2+-exporting ATPase